MSTTHHQAGRKLPFKQRRKRHARLPRANFQITSRDIELLVQVTRFRLLTRSQAIELDPRSGDFVARRLRDLYDHGFLERPKAQQARIFRGANAGAIYAITNQGVQLLREAMSDPAVQLAPKVAVLIRMLVSKRIDWSTRNARLKDAWHIKHTLQTTDIVLAFIKWAEHHGLALYDHYEVLPHMPSTTRASAKPFTLRVVLDLNDRNSRGQQRKRGVTPDRLLVFITQDKKRINILIENDKATMPDARSAFDDTSNLRKVAIYHTAWIEGLIQDKWDMDQLFVAFLTTSTTRARNMLAAQQTWLDDKGSRMFLFSELAHINAGIDPFSAIWHNGRGERQSLYPLPAKMK